jgi:hypothetical protein
MGTNAYRLWTLHVKNNFLKRRQSSKKLGLSEEKSYSEKNIRKKVHLSPPPSSALVSAAAAAASSASAYASTAAAADPFDWASANHATAADGAAGVRCT